MILIPMFEETGAKMAGGKKHQLPGDSVGDLLVP